MEDEIIPKKKIRKHAKTKASSDSVVTSITATEKHKIMDQSKVEWPDDYTMQEYTINEQIEALQTMQDDLEYNVKMKD